MDSEKKRNLRRGSAVKTAFACGADGRNAPVDCSAMHEDYESDAHAPSARDQRLELTEQERDLFRLKLSAISIITFFRGNPSETHLASRVKSLLAKNPWLGGRLRKEGRRLSVVYTAAPDLAQEIFTAANRADIHTGMQYEDLEAATREYCVTNSWGPEEPLFKVTLLTMGEHSAVLFSISHVIADGYTAFQLNAMLGSHTPVRALEATRLADSDEKRKELIGHEECGFFSKFLRRKNTVQVRRVNSEWIGAEKARRAAASALPCISSNDVLTSHFFSEAKCDFGIMAVNLRNRMEGCSDEHAGNYESGILYRPSDYATPDLVRRSLSGLRRCGPEPTELPDLWTTLKWRVAVVSNWASLYEELKLEGCEQVRQLPLYNSSSLASTNLVVFRDTPHTLSWVLFSHDEGLPEALDRHPMSAEPAWPVREEASARA